MVRVPGNNSPAAPIPRSGFVHGRIADLDAEGRRRPRSSRGDYRIGRVVQATFAAAPITSGAFSAPLSKWALQPARKVSIVTIPYCLNDRGFADPPALPLGGGRPAEGGGQPVAGVLAVLARLIGAVFAAAGLAAADDAFGEGRRSQLAGDGIALLPGLHVAFFFSPKREGRSGGGSRPPPGRLSRRRRARRPRTGG